MPVLKICKNCGKEFSVPPSRKKTAQFCSTKCKNEMGGWGKKKIEATCQYCGKTFRIWEAWIKKGGGKYCSRDCKDNSQKRDDVPITALIKSYENGTSSIQIGKDYNIPDVTVRRRLHEHGVDMRTPKEGIKLAYKEKVGPNNANFKNDGPRYNGNGYVLVWVGKDHPQADSRGNITEHRFVWQEVEKCFLPCDWDVHHINGKRDDNRRENLLALTKSNHSRLENAIRRGDDVTEMVDGFKAIEQQLIKILTS